MHKFGEVLGNEEWRKGTNVALAPSIDVVRVPEWGRTFESYGEDPYFNGQMAIAEIQGIQSQGPIADANMYLTMNQEDNRFKEDSIVDRRTLHEIYLPPFEVAIEEGHVGTVMCAYVKTNGSYSCENPYLLTTLLRKQLDFQGWVMSDWGATHSTVASAECRLRSGDARREILWRCVESGDCEWSGEFWPRLTNMSGGFWSRCFALGFSTNRKRERGTRMFARRSTLHFLCRRRSRAPYC